jgi:hypothetical protein
LEEWMTVSYGRKLRSMYTPSSLRMTSLAISLGQRMSIKREILSSKFCLIRYHLQH